MPIKSLHPCNRPGCPQLTRERFCPEHALEAAAESERARETAVQRGYDHRWSKIRIMKLSRDPLCERCLAMGREAPAVLVHHRDRNPKNNAPENHESLCMECHDREHVRDRFKPRRERGINLWNHEGNNRAGSHARVFQK